MASEWNKIIYNKMISYSQKKTKTVVFLKIICGFDKPLQKRSQTVK